MYPSNETKISYHYLKPVIQSLDEPLCMLGGWAIYFTVNVLFTKEKGFPYLGSRDIDLGFHDSKTARKAMEQLEQLGFQKISFRYYKEVHTETMKELNKEEARKTPLYDIFPMYVDLILSHTDSSMKTTLGFMPIDEPLLKKVFDHKEKREVEEFGRKLFIPSPALLLAMKLIALPQRDKEHKRIKDFCDITALCLYSGIALHILKQEVEIFTSKERIRKSVDVLTKDDYIQVKQILGVEEAILFDLVRKLSE